MKNYEFAVEALMEMFKKGNFAEQFALTLIKSKSEKPSNNWSLLNRLIMHVIGGTSDARTYMQWKKVDRTVVKGAKAFNIFAPITKKVKNEDEDEENKETIVLVGYKRLPVFAVEKTVGKPLEEEKEVEVEKKPPFLDVAEKMGIKVKWKPVHTNAYGYYSIKSDSITLCSQDYVVYFHELAHAVHSRIEKDWNKDNGRCEIIAEFTAVVLAEMLDVNGYEFQAYEYIQMYTDGKDDKAVIKAVNDVLNTVEKIVDKIISISNAETESESLRQPI